MAQSDDLKIWAVIVYVLYLIGSFTGIPTLVGVVMAYVKQNEGGSLWRSHWTFMIRGFWLGLLILVVGIVLSFVLIGVPILIALGLWWLVRNIVGVIKAATGEPIPKPESLLFGL